MFFAAVQRPEVTIKPAYALEFLSRVVRVSFSEFLFQMITDFLGGLDEELMRNNFVLVYELIDEMVDFGIVQNTNPEILKTMVNSQAEESFGSTVDYIWKHWMQDRLKFTDSMTEG